MADNRLSITVVVCTHNRSYYLAKCLQSLVSQEYPRDKYEIVVVDNASTDSTADVVHSIVSQAKGLPIVYLREERLGASTARNIGFHHSRGEIIAITDDDGVPEPQWLTELEYVFEQYPKAGCVGGPVAPIMEAERPSWLSLHLEPVIGIYKPHEQFSELHFPDYPRGVNCSFRRTALDAVGGLDPDLGRYGTILLSNEEIELVARIENAGYGVYYAPKVRVWHHIQSYRLSKPFFRKRMYWQGISDKVMDHKLQGWKYMARKRLMYLARLPHWAAVGLWSRRRDPESRSFLIEVQCWYMAGYSGILGFWKPK